MGRSWILLLLGRTLSSDPNVILRNGQWNGVTIVGRDLGSVNAYLGIPYGKADRFEFPVFHPLPPIFHANSKGPSCMSGCDFVVNTPYYCKTGAGESEDCLSLNVWVPKSTSDSPRKVIVLIHGGGFFTGSGGAPVIDGADFAKGMDSIVVSFNYRLGLFGFLSLKGRPGNYGFRDQQLALAWIVQNIEVFGGDPKDLTLMGFSAGAKSAACHLIAPSSKKYVQRVILHSGSWSLPLNGLQFAQEMSRFALQGVPQCEETTLSPSAYLECLQTQPVEDLQRANVLGFVFAVLEDFFHITEAYTPVIDSSVIPMDCFKGLKEGHYDTDVPIMALTTHNEGTVWIRGAFSIVGENFQSLVTPLLFNSLTYQLVMSTFFKDEEDKQKLLTLYPPGGDASYPGENGNQFGMSNRPDSASSLSSAFGDYLYSCSTRSLCANVDGPCYLGYFESGWSYVGKLSAKEEETPEGSLAAILRKFCREGEIRCHTEEMPWVLGTERLFVNGFSSTESEDDSASTYRKYISSFIRTNTPSSVGMPSWRRYSKGTDAWQRLSEKKGSAGMSPGYKKKFCDGWDSVRGEYDGSWKSTEERSGDCGAFTCAEHYRCVRTALGPRTGLSDRWKELFSENPARAAVALSARSLISPQYTCVNPLTNEVYPTAEVTRGNSIWDRISWDTPSRPLMNSFLNPSSSSSWTSNLSERESASHTEVEIGGVTVDLKQYTQRPRVIGNLFSVINKESESSATLNLLDHF